MLDQAQRDRIKPKIFTATILHGAMTASLLVYAVVIEIVTRTAGQMGDQESYKMLLPILAVMAGMDLVGGLVLRSFLMAPSRLVSSGSDIGTAFQRWLTAMIISDALFEAVAIFGLVLAFLGGGIEIYLPFAGAALLTMIFFWPTSRSFEERYEEGRRLAGRGT